MKLTPGIDFIFCFAPFAKHLLHKIASQKLGICLEREQIELSMLYAVGPTFMKLTPNRNSHFRTLAVEPVKATVPVQWFKCSDNLITQTHSKLCRQMIKLL